MNIVANGLNLQKGDKVITSDYYNAMGFVNTWREAPAYILLGYFLISALMVTTA